MRNPVKDVANLLLFPLRCLFPNNEYIGFLGVTPLSEERFKAVRPFLRGTVLDLGCGTNRLIKEYREKGGRGAGADLVGNPDADVVIAAGEGLPFQEQSFDTILLLASLNHIPDRQYVLGECFRCLAPGGRIVITMLDRIVGTVGHFVWGLLGSDADLKHREKSNGELMGMSREEVYRALNQAGFRNVRHHSFAFRLNNLYVAEKI
jgi:SAM-dependent methyltransferase